MTELNEKERIEAIFERWLDDRGDRAVWAVHTIDGVRSIIVATVEDHGAHGPALDITPLDQFLATEEAQS